MAFELHFQRRWIISAVALIAGGAILIAYFQAGPKAVSYARAKEAFAKWKASPENETFYEEMKTAFQTVPGQGDAHEASVAQSLMNKEKIAEALSFAQRPLQALKEEAPFHASFGETSLLIEQGAFQEALERSVSLKEQMVREWDIERLGKETPLAGGTILYAQNLLRIACLQKELENRPGEKVAWEELEAFLEKGPTASLIYGNFREKGIDLSHYIAERKRFLIL